MTRDARPAEAYESLAPGAGGLMAYIPRLSPEFREPWHLAPLTSLLDRAPHGNIRALVSPPVRHAKTETLKHAVVKWLKEDPTLRIGYFSYAAAFVQKISRSIRQLAMRAGIRLSKDFNTIQEWLTDEGGGLYAGSADQEVIGRGFDIAIFDDPIGREDVKLIAMRDAVDETIRFCTSRMNVGGSVFVVMSRFSEDDPIGRRERSGLSREWTHVQMPAIIDIDTPNERALWPDVRSLEHLKQVRAELIEAGDYSVWLGQYMGEPAGDEAGIFRGVTYYDVDPVFERDVIGIDAAFTPGKSADFFAAVVLGDCMLKAYIREVVRHQRGGQGMVNSIIALRVKYPGARLVSYVSGPEVGIYDWLFSLGIDIERMPARWNKGVRAKQTAHSWEEGKILVKRGAVWAPALVTEVRAFDGSGSASQRDDQADALVSAHDALQAGRPIQGFGGGFAFGRPVL